MDEVQQESTMSDFLQGERCTVAIMLLLVLYSSFNQ